MLKRTLLLILLIPIVLSGFAQNRTMDGTNNNLANPDWGAAGTNLKRITTIGYADGISAPGGTNRMNPREISNAIFNQSSSLTDPLNLSDYIWVWGQFVDHDITDVPSLQSEPAMIPVPSNDPWMGGTVDVIPMSRSIYDTNTGTSVANPRQHINMITSFLDASNVYGSDNHRAEWLRTFEDGKLKTSAGNLLPYNTYSGEYDDDIDPNTPHMADDVGFAPRLFVAGDVRANEQPLLIAFHTIFVREHNRVCDELKEQNLTWSDEQIYQHARKIVGGVFTSIIFEEWLPTMGVHVDPYTGYDPNVDPSISNLFSAAAFRWGHTLLNANIQRLDNDGNNMPQGSITLKDAFFNPATITEVGGIEPYFKGMGVQIQQNLDVKVISDIRNFLFVFPGFGAFGQDLAAININRGRERGLPDYNTVRNDLGLPSYSSFNQITPDPIVYEELEAVYDINDIDPWVGLLAEFHMPGTLFGPTIMRIMERQFAALRDGDRFYYENDPALSQAEKDEIKNTKLVDVIVRNTGITLMQDNVFESMPHDSINTCHALSDFADLTGTVATESGQVINNVDIIAGNSTFTTDANGQYFYTSIATCQDYSVFPYKNDNHSNGVSTIDLVNIQKHILGIETLDSPYKIIAADANDSNTITASDLIDLRRLILTIYSELPNNTSWRFVDSHYAFVDPTNPFGEYFPEQASVSMIADDMALDFVGIKIGDVTGNANPALFQANQTRNGRTLTLTTDDATLTKGAEHTLTLTTADIKNILGYQFTLNFDKEALEVLDIVPVLEGLDVSNFAVLANKGAITTSWNGIAAIDFTEDMPLFHIKFKAKNVTKLSEAITINSRLTNAEAYADGTQIELMDIELAFNAEHSETVSTFELYQNQPNPFKGATVIGFNLPENADIELTVFDIAGKQIATQNGTYAKGYNELSIDAANLPTTGILYYQISTDFGTLTKKMLLVE